MKRNPENVKTKLLNVMMRTDTYIFNEILTSLYMCGESKLKSDIAVGIVSKFLKYSLSKSKSQMKEQ